MAWNLIERGEKNGYNYLEVDYKEGELNNNCDYEVYTYFLKYQNTILMKDVSDQLQLKNYLSNFNVSKLFINLL